DGASMGIVIKEFMALYEGNELPTLQYQYKDYSQWWNRPNTHRKTYMEKQETYWKKEFEAQPPALELPIDYERPPIQGFEGSSIKFEIAKAELKGLKTLAGNSGATLYMTLLTAYTLLLSKLGGQETVTVGSPIAGRRHREIQSVIGVFINTLVMKNVAHGDITPLQLLENVKEKALKAYENQDYPFEDLVEKVKVGRNLSRNPLFDAFFMLQNYDIPTIRHTQLALKPYTRENRTAKFDITLQAVENGDKCSCIMEYSTKLFKPQTIRRFIAYFKNILGKVIENPQLNIRQLEIISPREKKQVLVEFNETRTPYPDNQPLPLLFREQVERYPENSALLWKDEPAEPASTTPEEAGELQRLTYREFDRKSSVLARLLQQNGVKPGSIVAIMAERTIEVVLGLYAILKAGGAYMP
ncbi:MAG: AMP-binding protein, partial [bacterium]|nr:AMP-binding protein [bacterium]